MQLHLTIPGLLWPSKALHNTTYDLDLPALPWLLGRGRLSWHAPRSLESWLCHAFDIDLKLNEPPVAALRLLGEEGKPDPGSDIWLCADPVHLRVEKGRMSLFSEAPAADAEEMQQIVATLAPLLEEFGEYQAGIDGRGYLRLKQFPRILTVPPSAASGESSLLPQGDDAPRWRQLCNEMQMLLHSHPLNAQRELEGRPTLNSIWFWGAGTLPKHKQDCRYDIVFGNDPLCAGLARWTDKPRQQPPAGLGDLLKMPAARVFLTLDSLAAPMRQFDALTWRERLAEIECDWLQPLRSALLAGRINSLRLTGLGDEAILDLTLSRSDLLRFWRRPKPLHTLTYIQSP